jgi:hypothetical protein
MVIFYGYGIDIQNAQNDLELLCYYHTYHISYIKIMRYNPITNSDPKYHKEFTNINRFFHHFAFQIAQKDMP